MISFDRSGNLSGKEAWKKRKFYERCYRFASLIHVYNIMDEFKDEKRDAERKNNMKMRLVKLNAEYVQSVLCSDESEGRILEDTECYEVGSDNNSEPPLLVLLLHAFGDQRNKQEIAERQPEDEEPVYRSPGHVENIARHQKQWHPEPVRCYPEQHKYGREKDQVLKTVKKQSLFSLTQRPRS